MSRWLASQVRCAEVYAGLLAGIIHAVALQCCYKYAEAHMSMHHVYEGARKTHKHY
jgi:hypothetical protein